MGKKDAKDVTVEDVMAFLSDGIKRGWKPKTTSQYATLCQIFVGEFHDDAFRKALRRQLRRLPKSQAHAALYEGIYVPPDKIDEFIARAPSEEWAVLYTMILKWGLRLGEAMRISPSDIDAMKCRLIVKGKGLGGFGKLRQVFVEKSTITRVLTFAGCTQEQILGEKPMRDTTPIIRGIGERNAEYQWKETAKKVGLKFWARNYRQTYFLPTTATRTPMREIPATLAATTTQGNSLTPRGLTVIVPVASCVPVHLNRDNLVNDPLGGGFFVLGQV